MAKDLNISPEDWQGLVCSVELRALSSTIFELDRLLSVSDVNLSEVVDVVLKDLTLTSRVLKIANGVGSAKSSNNLSLAASIEKIGFSGLRAICICTSWLDSRHEDLESKPELIEAIRSSFEVAVHARNIAARMEVNTEDSFVAGLLLNLGELAFWLSPIPRSVEFIHLLESESCSAEQAFIKLSGKNFNEMSKILAEQWGLSQLLLKALNVDACKEVKSILLGREISKASKCGWNSNEVTSILKSQQKALRLNITETMLMMKAGADEAETLSQSYQQGQSLWSPEKMAV